MQRWLARRSAALLCALALSGAATAPARAQPAGLHPDRYAAIVVEARSGQVLFAQQADEARHPASLTKMMTLYMLFEAIREGRVELSTPVRFSAEAASRPPSKLGVPPGGAISAESAILALVTRSANDVAAAVAEHLGGSEENFARMMTQRARQLGMTRTTFRNASGLPDWEQVTTARDMATLGRRLVADFPRFYPYFSATHFAHGGRLIRNHNGMLLDYDGADGIKTGFINASGYNIVTSAQRENVRLVGAVFGGTSFVGRNRHMAEIMDDGFERMGVRGRAAVASAPATRVLAGREPDFPPGVVFAARAATPVAAPSFGARARPAGAERHAAQQRRVAAAPSAATARRPAAAPPPARVAARRGERGGASASALSSASTARAPRASAAAAPRPAGTLGVLRVAQPPAALPAPTGARRAASPPPPAAAAQQRPAATRSADAAARAPRG